MVFQLKQVLIKTIACGVCHTDIHIHDGYFDLGNDNHVPSRMNETLTMGHEIYGELVEVGEDISDVEIGKKYVDKLELFDFRGSIEGWMRRIFSNTAIDAIRKAKRNPFLSDQDNDFKVPAENIMEEREALEELQVKYEVAMDCIDRLSPAYRTVFNMYVFEEYSHKEIAEILGISEGTSKSNLAKARMNLQKMLETKYKKIQH